MPIKVRFDKNGFYSPVYGRLGRGKNEGRVYTLPDEFGMRETIKVPVMDRSTKPPKQIGEKEVTRYKLLPSSATIIDEEYVSELRDELEHTGGDDAKEIEDELEQIKHAVRPKIATPSLSPSRKPFLAPKARCYPIKSWDRSSRKRAGT